MSFRCEQNVTLPLTFEVPSQKSKHAAGFLLRKHVLQVLFKLLILLLNYVPLPSLSIFHHSLIQGHLNLT